MTKRPKSVTVGNSIEPIDTGLPLDVLSKLLSLDAPSLRIIFDKAIEQWNEGKETVDTTFSNRKKDYEDNVAEYQKEIQTCLDRIQQLKMDIGREEKMMDDHSVEFEQQTHELFIKKEMIENLQNTLSDRIKGFKD